MFRYSCTIRVGDYWYLGDATPSLIIKQLKTYVKSKGKEISKESPFRVDIVKLSHHGGFSNNSPELFELVSADNYIISTNGRRHYHPHLETLAWLIHSHQEVHKKIYFNYSHNLESRSRNQHQRRLKKIMPRELWDKYNYEVILPESEGYQSIFI